MYICLRNTGMNVLWSSPLPVGIITYTILNASSTMIRPIYASHADLLRRTFEQKGAYIEQRIYRYSFNVLL